MSKQPEMVIARNSRATRNNDTTLNAAVNVPTASHFLSARIQRRAVERGNQDGHPNSMSTASAGGSRGHYRLCYERLSQEDKLDGESNSISNQKRILEKYCRDHGYTAIATTTRTTDIREPTSTGPDSSGCLPTSRQARIKRVVVKDMSRFKRNYLQVGMYTEMLFQSAASTLLPSMTVWTVCAGTASLPPSATYSMKCTPRTPARKSGQRGNPKDAPANTSPLSRLMGTRKDPENKKRWIVDEEVAAVVRRFLHCAWTAWGRRKLQKWLQEIKVLSPVAYCYENDLPTTSKRPTDPL